MTVHDPGGLGFPIENIWAYVVVHGDEDEGIPAVKVGSMMMPLVGGDEQRVRDLRKYAQSMANQSGKQIKLVRYEMTEVEEVIEPHGGDG